MKSIAIAVLVFGGAFPLISKSNLYVQSAKAKLLSQPKLNAEGISLKLGELLSPINEQGLFVQVRVSDRSGWVSKLFVSPLPPGNQIQLGISSSSTEAVVARQRASDFTKTAAARGLSETQKLRVRGEGDLYDFDSLRWLESLPRKNSHNLNNENGIQTNDRFEEKSDPMSNLSLLSETQAEVKVGRSLAARILKRFPLNRNKELTVYLNQIGSRIASVSSRPDLDFVIGILESDEINAYACPGGFIFITTGTLKKIQSESELAGIIAHEIGHIVLFHNGEFQQSNLFVDIIAGILAPTGGEVINASTSLLLDQLEKEIFESGRDKQKEFDADEAGVGLAAQAGYPASGLGNFLYTMSKTADQEAFKKTHPDTKVRIAKLVVVEVTANSSNDSIAPDNWQNFKSKLNP